MIIDWTPLRDSLVRQRRAGQALPVWWRDDDAVSSTGALQHLIALAEEMGVTVHLAIVPRLADDSLVADVMGTRALVPVVHGWRHDNHAPPDAKKSEFGTPRRDARTEIEQALAVMRARFGARLLPLFVPPWNRIDAGLLPDLAAAGYRGLSTFTPRKARLAATGLVQINTHIDPIDWRGTRDLVAPEVLIVRIATLIDNRTDGVTDATEPLGYLTHHLVHSPPLWEFSRQLMTELLEGGAEYQPITPLLEAKE